MSKTLNITRPNLHKACEAAGGQVALAEKVGCKQQFIWHLLNRAQTIKADMAMTISRATGVPLEALISDFSESP